MTNRTIPMDSETLRNIATQLDTISDAIGCDFDDNDWRWGISVNIFDDMGNTIGQVRPHGDGWLGFFPRSLEAQDNVIVFNS